MADNRRRFDVLTLNGRRYWGVHRSFLFTRSAADQRSDHYAQRFDRMRQQSKPSPHACVSAMCHDSYRLALREAVAFVHRGVDDATIELLTGIDWETAWEAAARGVAPSTHFLPLPHEIAEREVALRMGRPVVVEVAEEENEEETEPPFEDLTDAYLAIA